MSKLKKGNPTPAVIVKDGNKTVYKCGEKHSLEYKREKPENKAEVENGTES